MAARNGPDSFGWVSRAFHWIMAVAILGMLAFGTYLANLQPSLDTLWLYGFHKSIGMSLLALVLARLLWHRITPPPASIRAGIPGWQVKSAAISHATLYGLMLAVPLAGWIASSATGIDTVFFNRVTLPAIAPVSERWEKVFFAAHGFLTKALLLVIVVHVAGAFHRHFIHRDTTLRRMIRG